MANLFANLPLPALNGPGAAVDTSGMGSPKTIIIAGDFVGATITVECSEDGGVVFAPLVTFQTGDRQVVIPVAAQFMRVNVSGRKAAVPFSADVDVSASDIGGLFTTIPMPALNGPGVAVNVSAFGVFGTLISGGVFQGATITVEGSDDSVAYAPVQQFAGQGGLVSQEITANFLRANVSGRKASVPFTGTLAFGAIVDAVGPSPAFPGDSNALIYRPGSVFTGPVVFNDFADLYAQLQLMRSQANGSGVYEIVFDDSIVTPCPVPAAAYDMTLVTWAGILGKTSAVQIVQGTTFTGLRRFVDNLAVTFTGAAPPVSDFLNGDVVAILGDSTVRCTGAGPFFRNTLVAGLVTFKIDAGGVIAGAFPVIDTSAVGGSTAILLSTARAAVGANTLKSIAGSVVTLATEASGITLGSETQPAVLGTFTVINTTKWRIDPTPLPPAGPITADTVLSAANELALVNPAGLFPVALAITLPAAAGASPNRGQTVIVKNVSAAPGIISILPPGGNTIDGGGGVVLASPLGSMTFISDGVNNWRQIRPSDAGNPVQSFSYTVTGVEPDLSELVIPLPAARTNVNYSVTPSQGTATFGLARNVANASRTTTQFVLSLSGLSTAGDVFWFLVTDL